MRETINELNLEEMDNNNNNDGHEDAIIKKEDYDCNYNTNIYIKDNDKCETNSICAINKQ